MAASLLELTGQTDIYLLDQIMKGRYMPGQVVLDAGCGTGRNLHWFSQSGFTVYGVDTNAEAIDFLHHNHPELSATHFRAEPVDALSFEDEMFDHVISSAVLHFAKNEVHFFAMLHEMVRVLRPGGSLFIRMATDIGIENAVVAAGNGVYYLPDGSTRFLLTRHLLQQIMKQYPLSFLEPFKVVNVADQRCMSTLVMRKGL